MILVRRWVAGVSATVSAADMGTLRFCENKGFLDMGLGTRGAESNWGSRREMSNKQRRSWKHKGDARDGKGKMGAAQTTETKDGNKKTERAL